MKLPKASPGAVIAIGSLAIFGGFLLLGALLGGNFLLTEWAIHTSNHARDIAAAKAQAAVNAAAAKAQAQQLAQAVKTCRALHGLDLARIGATHVTHNPHNYGNRLQVHIHDVYQQSGCRQLLNLVRGQHGGSAPHPDPSHSR